MFGSRFGRRPAALTRNFPLDDNEQNLSTNPIPRNPRSGQQTYGHENNQEQLDSIHSGQNQPTVSSRKNQEGVRFTRYGNNRRSSENWKRQPSVRQADSSQTVPLYSKNSSRNSNNKLKLQPAVVGTNTFQPPIKSGESSSPRNVPASNQRKLSIASELPSELSSSFCYVTQGNLAKTSILDDFRQTDTAAFTPEPDKVVTDYCVYCLNKQNFTTATHHCGNCGPFGRYLCQRCLGPHNEFTENHNIKSLSGHSFKKHDDETTKKQHLDTTGTELEKAGKHPNFIKDVSVTTEDDDQSCQITGFCQLENGTIVLTEMNNKAIKTLDCHSYQVTNTKQLQDYPMDICWTDDSEALVILYKSTIQYITVDADDHIQLKRKQDLKHDCICLAYNSGKIFVGSSKSLYIYDKKWSKLDKITNELFGEELIFSHQFSIAISMHDDVTTIFVADENTGMYSIELTGNELATTWKFKDCNTFKASGLCMDSCNNVLLSDRGSERLIKMNAEGMILAILLDSSSGIQLLNIPFYNRKNDNLILSLSGKDIIKVFDFK